MAPDVSDEIDGFSIKHFIEPCEYHRPIAIFPIGSEFDIERRRTSSVDLFSPDDGLLRVLSRRHQQIAHRPTPLVLRCWARRPRENLPNCAASSLSTVPTKSYAANSAWQQLNVLAHNLRSFQLDTKRKASLESVHAPICCTPSAPSASASSTKPAASFALVGRNALRMATNSSTQTNRTR